MPFDTLQIVDNRKVSVFSVLSQLVFARHAFICEAEKRIHIAI